MLNDSGNNRRGGRPAPPPRASAAAARRNQSTMNRPGAESLNSNAEATVAAKFFAKDIGGENYRPSLANAFIAPVIEKKPEEEVKSPFKAAPKAPIKRPKNITNAALGSDEEDQRFLLYKCSRRSMPFRFCLNAALSNCAIWTSIGSKRHSRYRRS